MYEVKDMKIIKIAGIFIAGMAIMALSVPLTTGCAMEEYTITSQSSSTSSGGTSTSSGGTSTSSGGTSTSSGGTSTSSGGTSTSSGGGAEVLYDDFEDGDLVNSLAGGSIDMWKDAGGDATMINSNGDAHGGSRSLLIWISRPNSSAGATADLIRSSDWSISNTYDTVRAWVKAKGATGSFLCMGRETTDNEWSHANFDSSNSWQQIETSSSTFGLRYILFSTQSLTTASLYVDDVTVSNSTGGGTSTSTSSGTSTSTSISTGGSMPEWTGSSQFMIQGSANGSGGGGGVKSDYDGEWASSGGYAARCTCGYDGSQYTLTFNTGTDNWYRQYIYQGGSIYDGSSYNYLVIGYLHTCQEDYESDAPSTIRMSVLYKNSSGSIVESPEVEWQTSGKWQVNRIAYDLNTGGIDKSKLVGWKYHFIYASYSGAVTNKIDDVKLGN